MPDLAKTEKSIRGIKRFDRGCKEECIAGKIIKKMIELLLLTSVSLARVSWSCGQKFLTLTMAEISK